MRSGVSLFVVLVILLLGREASAARADLREVRAKEPQIRSEVKSMGLVWGNPIYLRAFKETTSENSGRDSGVLELWIKTKKQEYALYKTFPICYFSGIIGHKTRDGDRQTPEGAYEIEYFNPASDNYLAFELNYPNSYDRAHDLTGNSIMIHGGCGSVGCLAMGDAAMDEIFLIANAAKNKGFFSVPVHIFPFRMTMSNLRSHRDRNHEEFWQQLKPIFDEFEDTHRVPTVRVVRGKYKVARIDNLGGTSLAKNPGKKKRRSKNRKMRSKRKAIERVYSSVKLSYFK